MSVLPGEIRSEEISDFGRYEADKAIKEDKKLSSEVYKKCQGYTAANFR